MMIKKAGLILFLLLLFLIFSVGESEAARNLSISANKSSLFGEEELTITASASGFTDGETIYIKGAFYKDGTTNKYFGYTKNGDNWIKNGDANLNQRQIKIGEWDGNLIVRSDFSDGDYVGEGDYKFKVGFYYTTSGGNLSSVNWSANIVDVNLDEPDPSPTNVPATNTPISPSQTKTPTPTRTPTSTPTKTPTPAKKLQEKEAGTKDLFIAGETKLALDKSPTPEAKVLGKSTSKSPFIFIALGLIVITVCGILAYLRFGDKIFLWKKKSL